MRLNTFSAIPASNHRVKTRVVTASASDELIDSANGFSSYPQQATEFKATGQIMSVSTLETLNNEQFEEMRELLEDDFVELIQTFISDSKQRLKEIITAYQDGDNLTGYDSAHSLKGACANLGAPALADLCYKLQIQCRERQIYDSRALIESIGEELKNVITEVSQRIS